MSKQNSLYKGRAKTDRLLRLSEVLEIVPVSRTTWYEGMKIGIYPQAISLGGRRVAWWQQSVLDCIDEINKPSKSAKPMTPS